MTHRVRGCLVLSFTVRRSALRFVAAVLLAFATPIVAVAQSLDTLVTWNRILLTGVATPGANPPTVFITRPLALVSAAVFDAANRFDRLYHPVFTWVEVPEGASRDAAVAQAAHDALVSVMPSQTAVFDAALATAPAGIPTQAAADGAAAAKAAIEARTGDGWERSFPPLVLPSLPGYWKPPPPANSQATSTNYSDVTGFIVRKRPPLSGRRAAAPHQ